MGSRRSALAAEFMQAFCEHRTDAILAFFHPDAIWEFPVGPEPQGTTFRGHADLRRAMETMWRAFPDIFWVNLRIHDAGATIVYEVVTESKSKDLSVHSVDILTFDDDDLIVTKRAYRKVNDTAPG
jgi:ketosteroid isomerase-like protein